jgi:hypothetical protein
VLVIERRSQLGWWRAIAAIEVVLATGAILLDAVVPTIAVVGLAAVSLALRRAHLVTLGLRRLADPVRDALGVLALVIAWTLLQLSVIMPTLNHLTGLAAGPVRAGRSRGQPRPARRLPGTDLDRRRVR